MAGRGIATSAERIRIAEAARINGSKRRTLQKMAAQGIIPGAAKIDSGWSFNEGALRAWVRTKEMERCRSHATSTSATAAGICESRLMVESDDEVYERAMKRLLSPGRQPSERRR